jgi:hypothetical protein
MEVVHLKEMEEIWEWMEVHLRRQLLNESN